MNPSSPADPISRGIAGAVLGIATLTAVVLAATEGSNASSPSASTLPSSPSSSSSSGLAPKAAPAVPPRDCVERLEPDFPFPAGSRRTTITTDSRAEKVFGRVVRSDLEPVRAFYARELAARGIRWAPLASDSPIGTGSWFGGLDSDELEFGCYLNLSDSDASGNGPAGTVTISVELR